MKTKNAFCLPQECGIVGSLSFAVCAPSLPSPRFNVILAELAETRARLAVGHSVLQIFLFRPRNAHTRAKPLSPPVLTGEQARPEYKGQFIPSPINGRTIL